MYYDETGNELKKFNTTYSSGIIFLQLLNIPVAIITGETTKIVKRRVEKLKIDHLYMGVSNKLAIAKELCSSLKIAIEHVAYIGDDINDIELLNVVGLSATPENAPEYIKKLVHWVIPVKGGEGAFRAFVEKYLNEVNLLEYVIEKFILLHKTIKQ